MLRLRMEEVGPRNLWPNKGQKGTFNEPPKTIGCCLLVIGCRLLILWLLVIGCCWLVIEPYLSIQQMQTRMFLFLKFPLCSGVRVYFRGLFLRGNWISKSRLFHLPGFSMGSKGFWEYGIFLVVLIKMGCLQKLVYSLLSRRVTMDHICFHHLFAAWFLSLF